MSVKVPLLRLEKEITAFEDQPKKTGRILFYGDSIFTRWNTTKGVPKLESSIPNTQNHGFGSSTAEEQLYYYDRAVKPYAPKAIVHKTFGNDTLFGYEPDEILFLCERMYAYARCDFPGIRFYLFGPIANHGRYAKVPNMQKNRLAFDALLQKYAKAHDDCTYVSVMQHSVFVEQENKKSDEAIVKRELFIKDGVHFNETGYMHFTDLWKKILQND